MATVRFLIFPASAGPVTTMSEISSTHLTLLSKNDMFSFLGVVQTEADEEDDFDFEPMNAVIKLDPRDSQPFVKEFETHREAVRSYRKAVDTSIERGWRVIYRGQPMFG